MNNTSNILFGITLVLFGLCVWLDLLWICWRHPKVRQFFWKRQEKRRLRKALKNPPPLSNGKADLTREQAYLLNHALRCPDCGMEDFLGGPRAGIAQNILCHYCGSEFCYAPPFLPNRVQRSAGTKAKLYDIR